MLLSSPSMACQRYQAEGCIEKSCERTILLGMNFQFEIKRSRGKKKQETTGLDPVCAERDTKAKQTKLSVWNCVSVKNAMSVKNIVSMKNAVSVKCAVSLSGDAFVCGGQGKTHREQWKTRCFQQVMFREADGMLCHRDKIARQADASCFAGVKLLLIE